MSERTVQQPVAAQRQAKFSDLPTADVDRSTFDMSHSWKGTSDVYKIIPVLNQEILPGDTFNVSSTVFMRLATPLKPIMDNLTADIHYFFVPNRLVWDNWQAFMGERKNVDDDPAELTIPQVNVDLDITTSGGQLPDYFGLPLFDNGGQPFMTQVCTFPFRGYQLIWTEWYRNQNINDAIFPPFHDGPDNLVYDGNGMGHCAPRHKRGDYFTRALPWPQKGDPVYLPLGTEAPVLGIGTGDSIFATTNQNVYEADGTVRQYPFSKAVGGDNSQVYIRSSAGADDGVPNIRADLTTATAATINDIRTAFQVQKLLERDARGGTRYIEIILSHFNVQSPDARLQRPEYLGGGSSKIIVNPVAATVATEDAPQGNLSAVGTGLLKGSFNHSFTEHGYIFGLLSCRSDLTYQKGIDRSFSRRTRYDYYWPSLSHLGEQAILNKEIYFSNDPVIDDDTWGFQERYAEYRYQPSRICGKFRSEDPESLDVWHLSQDFTVLPPLSPLFVGDLPPMDRVVAVPSEPDLIIDCWHEIKATRPMPVYAVPGLVDHF